MIFKHEALAFVKWGRAALVAVALAPIVSCQLEQRSATDIQRIVPPGAAVATTSPATLSPTADTYLNLDDLSHATEDTLNLYTWPDNEVANAIVMKFDLSSIPVGSTISSATLSLYLRGSDATADPTYTVTVHKIVNKNPDPNRATGHTYDGVNNWTPSTCCYNGFPLAQADIGPAVDTRSIDKTAGYKTWDVTAIARDWFTSPGSNYGLLVNSDPSKLADHYRQFSSSEASNAPYMTIIYTSVAPALVEDFSTYASTADMLADPRYSNEDPFNTSSANVLDQTVGLNVGGYSLTQSYRIDFADQTPHRTPPDSTRCGDYTPGGRNLNFPTRVTEVWIEAWIMFPTNFTTQAPSGWGCNSNPDYKLALVRISGGTKDSRANLTPGTYGASWTWGISSDQQGNGGQPTGTIPFGQTGSPWDGQWHQYRVHLMLDRSGTSGHYTAGDWWMDGVLRKSFPGVTDASAEFGTWYGVAMGRNLNQGPDHAMSYWWGRIAVWTSDPGWGVY